MTFGSTLYLPAISQGFRDRLSTGSPGPMAADSPGPERPYSETPTYVNIPISPTSRLQLHYMDLELSGASAGVRGGLQPQASQGSCDLSFGSEPQVHQPWLESPSSEPVSDLPKQPRPSASAPPPAPAQPPELLPKFWQDCWGGDGNG